MQVKHLVHIQQLLADINKVINKNRNFNFLYNEAEIKTGRGCNYGNLGPTSHLMILRIFFKKRLCPQGWMTVWGGNDEGT